MNAHLLFTHSLFPPSHPSLESKRERKRERKEGLYQKKDDVKPDTFIRTVNTSKTCFTGNSVIDINIIRIVGVMY